MFSINQKYTDALMMLDKTSWPGVDLDSPDAEQVVDALSDYAYANLEAGIRWDAYKSVTRITHPNPKEREIEKVRLHKLVVQCDRQTREKLEVLHSLIGDEDDEKHWMDAFRGQYDKLLE